MKPFYYKAADIFVLPSTMTTEVFPLTILEAYSSSLPIIVSDLKTFKQIVNDGWNGIIVERFNHNKLAEAIIYLLENKKVRKKIGLNANKTAKTYSWSRIALLTEKCYGELV